MSKKSSILIVLTFILIAMLAVACGKSSSKIEKISDLEYTVLPETEWPKIITQEIEKRKANPFKMTYNDGTYLYICKGYGKQATGGYSIAVKELFLSPNAIYFDTTLAGPTPDSPPVEGESYPVIVIKTENLDKSVVFE